MNACPTPPVNARYGAPMGRQSDVLSALQIIGEVVTLRLIPIDAGGYDAGGAYWGADEPLYYWSVTIEEGDARDECAGFFRAASRAAAEREVLDSHASAKIAWDESSSLHVDSVLEISALSEQCILECSARGDVGDAVARWRDAMGFTVNRERAVACLAGYGAWSREELDQSSDVEIAERILFLACGNFGEFITRCQNEGIDPFGELPNGFEASSGSDIFVLE